VLKRAHRYDLIVLSRLDLSFNPSMGTARPTEPARLCSSQKSRARIRGPACTFFLARQKHDPPRRHRTQSAQAMASTMTRLVLVKDAAPVWLNFGATAFLQDIAAGHFNGSQVQDIFDWATTENRNRTWRIDDQKHAFRVDGDGRLLYRLPGDRHGPVWVEVKPVSLSRQADKQEFYNPARLVIVARTAQTRSDAAAG
jgi:hypothetical protein